MSTVEPVRVDWRGDERLASRYYQCGYCDANVASERGYQTPLVPHDDNPVIYLCAGCNRPSFFFRSTQTPCPSIGSHVSSLPREIHQIYEEARRCSTVGAYTSAVLTCRKLMMHIAVNKGAPENRSFADYIEYLVSTGYVPPDGKDWVEQIRLQGNEANHEIVLKSSDDANDVVSFAEMLLRFIYELPAKVRKPPS